MAELKEGIYEQVINKVLKQEIDKNSVDYYTYIEKIDKAESSKIFADYLSKIIEKSLNILEEKNREDSILNKIKLVNNILNVVKDTINDEELENDKIDISASQLLSVSKKVNNVSNINNKKVDIISRPETSIAQSSLFTGAKHEPQMQSEIKKEILSSDRVDILVSFIKWSGLRMIIEELREFTEKGGKLRVITTSYMGATDVKAIDELSKLSNTKIKVNYDTRITRLHAKSYIFHRETGFTTAYVGSSNVSNAALTSGLEWNVKITKQDQRETIEKIEATFDSYWNSYEFEEYTEGSFKKLKDAIFAEKRKDIYLKDSDNKYILDIRPYSYQQEVLDKLQAERKIKHRNKNLIVAATGVGKTVISAFDYKLFKEENRKKGKCRLLFIAHREEILKQSIETFRAILKDVNFGDLCTGNFEPENIDYLFITIQSFNSKKFIEKTSQDFYDYIVIDEFHHAAAKSYKKLLEHYKPKILLGLTATPERMDGKHNELYEIFDNKIAAEIRLPEAIDRKLLCPFQYFGVSDDTDLSKLKWSRGGYDVKELSDIYVFNKKISEKRANHIIDSTIKYVNDINEVKGIGFCVSVEHAKFMCKFFNLRKIKSIYLTGQSNYEERNTAKEKLKSGEVKFIFVVDLYNEGVDIPEINTVLFLRPTESLTIFLQQLGRGLRLSEGKDYLTVLDFIGQANKKYNFVDKFSALLDSRDLNIQDQINNGFTRVPKGCFIQLERKAKKFVLDNIKCSLGNKNLLISKIKDFESDTGLELNLANFMDYYHIGIKDYYRKNSFYRMLVEAGRKEDFTEEYEEIIKKSFKKFIYCDSEKFIDFIVDILSSNSKIDITKMNNEEKRMLNMFNITIWQKDYEQGKIRPVEAVYKIKRSRNMCQELIELLKYNKDKINYVSKDIKKEIGYECPLELYSTYTRDQILAAFDNNKPSTCREGIKSIKDKKSEILFITLNKSDKDYSPTTLYKDYSINEYLFHWQSQSSTSPDSNTGKKYINHRKMGYKILLFVREYKNYKNNKDMTEAYTFLGTAKFVEYQGSKPMNIIWRLDNPIPSKLINKTSKLLVQ